MLAEFFTEMGREKFIAGLGLKPLKEGHITHMALYGEIGERFDVAAKQQQAPAFLNRRSRAACAIGGAPAEMKSQAGQQTGRSKPGKGADSQIDPGNLEQPMRNFVHRGLNSTIGRGTFLWLSQRAG